MNGVVYLVHEFVYSPTPKEQILNIACETFEVADKLCKELKKRSPKREYFCHGVVIVETSEEGLEILFPKPEPPQAIICPDDMPDEFFRKLGDW